MRNLLLAASCAVLLGSGCQLTQPLRTPDSLDNATLLTWAVTADFASGLRHTYKQEPQSFSDFGVMSRGSIPVLTNVVAISRGSSPLRYSLSAREISKLRRATQGGLTLVLYEDGIGCLSAETKRTLEQEIKERGRTRDEYFSLLKTHGKEALEWTRRTLARP
jgi:hypothetical protein